MANLFSNISFNQNSIDLNLLIRAQTGFYPSDNVRYTYNGIIYEDLLELDYYSSGYRAGIWGGTGITYKSDYSAVTGGTVTGYLEYYWNGVSYVPGYGIEGLSAKATDFYKAATSTSTSDDIKLIEKILSGNDYFSLSNYDDVVDGGAGNDSVVANGGNDVVYGNKGDDDLAGGSGNDELYGGLGNDTLTGGLGVDYLDRGAGNDTYIMSDALDTIIDSAGVDTVRTSLTAFTLTDASKIENLIYTGSSDAEMTGNGLNNVITGGSGVDYLLGMAGADTLSGGLGNDILSGGTGKDVLTGGDGYDAFLFNVGLNASSNLDKITDFGSTDFFMLEHSIFNALPYSSSSTYTRISASNFINGAKALDANDYLLYNNGTLSYDADGSGSGKAVAFVTLVGAPALDYLDFFVY